MASIQVPETLLYPMISMSFVMIVGLMAWIVKTLMSITTQLSDHGARIEHLEKEPV